jgi:hypothetical protein
VQGNLVGTDAAGASAVPNGQSGVSLSQGAASNTIGGTAAGAGNVLSGNGSAGVALAGTGTSSNVVAGNDVGTSASGNAAIPNTSGVRIGNGASSNTIGGTTAGAGNVVSGNLYDGVTISDSTTSGNLVQGNLVGTTPDGMSAIPNSELGVLLYGGAHDNTIGGADASARNVVSGNGLDGVRIAGPGTSNNVVAANYVGTDATGMASLANAFNGVLIFDGAQFNLVGGTTAGARNLVSGNVHDGVVIADTGTSSNRVQGNYIGTDATGGAAIPNGTGGGSGVGIYVGATDNTIGGTTKRARNLISGNAFFGVDVGGAGASGNVVQGNFVGTDASGTSPVPNLSGIVVELGASGNTIGGTKAGAGNVASGNSFAGIEVTDDGGTPPGSTSGNTIQGNFAGTDPSGTTPVANGSFGVLFTNGANDNLLGGTSASAKNTIAFNGGAGVRVEAPDDGFTTIGDSILRNSIFENAGLGIELLANGNDLQSAPKVTSISTSGGTTTVRAKLTAAAPSTQFRIELFSSPTCDPSGAGEGKDYLATKKVTTRANGSKRFSISVAALPPGLAITETATDLASGDTSQFSNCGTTP